MGAIHDAIRRLKDQPCRCCSFSDRKVRVFLIVTKHLEFPKPSTPSNETIVLCEECYRPARTILLLQAYWKVEEKRTTLKVCA